MAQQKSGRVQAAILRRIVQRPLAQVVLGVDAGLIGRQHFRDMRRNASAFSRLLDALFHNLAGLFEMPVTRLSVERRSLD